MSGYSFPLMVILRLAQENHGRDYVPVHPALADELSPVRNYGAARLAVALQGILDLAR